eukprot:Skav215101  [mRNA]  locus=scaffold899:148454:148717:- [translate_table: standard]
MRQNNLGGVGEVLCHGQWVTTSWVMPWIAKDTVADGVSNSFLRLLDKSSDKLKERVDKLEDAPCSSAAGAAMKPLKDAVRKCQRMKA